MDLISADWFRRLAPAWAIFLAACVCAEARAQAENPVRSEVRAVEGAPRVSPVEGEVVPLIWKASIGDSIVSVPLRYVEYFGVQNYDVDGATRVRELTIGVRSKGLVRIYHIRPLQDPSGRAGEAVNRLRQLAEGATGEEFDRPVKVFPQTTHAHMVEYRVEQAGMITQMYEHLEAAMADYHARDLVCSQRMETVREIRFTN